MCGWVAVLVLVLVLVRCGAVWVWVWVWVWVLNAFYGFARVQEGFAGWRSSVVCLVSRWRPAVSLFTTARRSESLRMRLVWRLSAAFEGHQKSTAGLRRAPRRGGTGGSGGSARVRDGSAFLVPHGAAPRYSPPVLLVVAVSWVPRRVPPEGTSPVWRCQAASHLLGCCFARLDTASPDRLATPVTRRGTQDKTHLWCQGPTCHTMPGSYCTDSPEPSSSPGTVTPLPPATELLRVLFQLLLGPSSCLGVVPPLPQWSSLRVWLHHFSGAAGLSGRRQGGGGTGLSWLSGVWQVDPSFP
jgi:hypothetical protein